MSEYRFHLQKYKYGSKISCPSCGKPRCFVKYVDAEGEIAFPGNVGKCDHENSCGYHYTPKEYFNKSVDRHINLTNRLLRRFCRGLSNDLENVRNSLLCVSILSRDPFQIQRYEFSLNLQKYSVQVLYKTKARGYEPRTFFPFISCYHVGWFRRRVAIRLKGFSANYEK